MSGTPRQLIKLIEDDCEWLMARPLLNGIVNFMRDRPLVAHASAQGHATFAVTIGPEIPFVRDEATEKLVSVYSMVPKGILGLVDDAIQETLELYERQNSAAFDAIHSCALGHPASRETIRMISAQLAHIENVRVRQGRGEFWRLLSLRFGVYGDPDPLCPPMHSLGVQQ